MRMRNRWTCCVGVVVAALSFTCTAWPQEMSSLERGGVLEMLQTVSREVSKHYYDRNLDGVDWNAKVKEAKERIERETQDTLAFGDIAAALEALNDSHTFFVPPRHSYRFDYGWQYQVVGDQCFVTHLRPGSDADSKGVKPGDEVVAINRFRPARDNLSEMKYILLTLRPQPDLTVRLRNPEGHERELQLATTVIQQPNLPASVLHRESRLEAEDVRHVSRTRTAEVGDDLMILKIAALFFTDLEVRHLMGRARNHKGLIIDLRDCPGGSLESLKYLVGGVFDHEIKIADQIERDQSKPLMAKSMGGSAFMGKLVVLIDSESASGAELFARTIQIEKRGTILGDRSSGRVMEAQHYTYPLGASFYGLSLTVANPIMPDGSSLEHRGVTPDEIVLPTASDMASGRDPVLARAAATLGVKLSAEEAAQFFPYEWPPISPSGSP